MNRRLAAMHPSLNLQYDGGINWSVIPLSPPNGWSTLTSNAGFFHETQIDLSGYAMDSLTFFPSAVGVQDPGIYRFAPKADSLTSGLYVFDLITSTPINPSDIMINDLLLGNYGPGMF